MKDENNSKDTPITNLRNKLTPFINLASMVMNVESDKLQDLIKKESRVCNQNHPDVIQLIDQIEEAVKEKEKEIEALELEIKTMQGVIDKYITENNSGSGEVGDTEKTAEQYPLNFIRFITGFPIENIKGRYEEWRSRRP